MKHCDKTAVTVNCTNQCNLRCEYCMAASACEQADPITISLAFAKKGIGDALRGYPTNIRATTLRFFSPGEPTQRIEVMRECVEFARSINPEIRTELQTNGLFKSPADTEWIARNFSVVWFSLDGPPRINDVHRPDQDGRGRTVEIEANMQVVAEHTSVGVRSTIVEESLQHQDEIVDHYVALGVKNLAFNPVIRPICRNDSGNVPVTKVSIMDFARGFVAAHSRAQLLGVSLVNSLTFNFDEPTSVCCRSCLPMPQLNPDGSVSSCDMALYRDTKQELHCFVYGSWNQEQSEIDYDREKIHHLQNRRLENLPHCKNCEVARYCAGGCAGRIAFQTGDIYSYIPEYCAATKYLGRLLKLGTRSLEFSHP